MSTDSDNNRSGWKQIAKAQRKTGKPTTTPEGQPISVSSTQTLYILYNKQPICVYNGELYAMYPIDTPSIGYSLIETDYDRNIILIKPCIITEVQALNILFLKQYDTPDVKRDPLTNLPAQ